jgi:hypothetical protein
MGTDTHRVVSRMGSFVGLTPAFQLRTGDAQHARSNCFNKLAFVLIVASAQESSRDQKLNNAFRDISTEENILKLEYARPNFGHRTA